MQSRHLAIIVAMASHGGGKSTKTPQALANQKRILDFFSHDSNSKKTKTDQNNNNITSPNVTPSPPHWCKLQTKR